MCVYVHAHGVCMHRCVFLPRVLFSNKSIWLLYSHWMHADIWIVGNEPLSRIVPQGFYKKAYYIAAQGPLQSSIGDFWQMIWDNEIQVIVMLSQLTEDDEVINCRRTGLTGSKLDEPINAPCVLQILCPQYWPVNLQTPEKFDSITVELLSEKALESYTVRSIKLTQQTVR